MQIYNAQGEPYFSTPGLDISASGDLGWIDLSPYRVVTISCELSLGGTGITGDLYGEMTSNPTHVKGFSRVVWPDGSLHTNAAGVTLPTNRQAVALAAAANGAAFTLSFSYPGVRWFRLRWSRTSGGSAPNRLLGWIEAKEGP